MDNHLGLGVMLNRLCGNADTVAAVHASIGNKLQRLKVSDETLRLVFENGTTLVLWDAGQSCCAHRYMRTDDDLQYYVGATLQKIEVLDGPLEQDESCRYVHESQFLRVTTSKGDFTIVTPNEHNGNYGGISIAAKLIGGKRWA